MINRHVCLLRPSFLFSIFLVSSMCAPFLRFDFRVSCPYLVSPYQFASGSLDGIIVVWQSESLTPLKILHHPDRFKNAEKMYDSNVPHVYITNCLVSSNCSLVPRLIVRSFVCITPWPLIALVYKWRFVYNVRKLSVFHGRFLGAAIGSSLRVYDIKSGNVVFSIDNVSAKLRWAPLTRRVWLIYWMTV